MRFAAPYNSILNYAAKISIYFERTNRWRNNLEKHVTCGTVFNSLCAGGVPPVPPDEDFGEDGAGNAVPRTADGARHHGKGMRGHKEGHGEVRAEAGVLHAHLDAQRALLGCRETAEMCYSITQEITESIVA